MHKILTSRWILVPIAFGFGALGCWAVMRQPSQAWNGILVENSGWPVGWGKFVETAKFVSLPDHKTPAPKGWFRWTRWTIENDGALSNACYVRTDDSGNWQAYYSLLDLVDSGLFNRHYVDKNGIMERISWNETFDNIRYRSFFTKQSDVE